MSDISQLLLHLRTTRNRIRLRRQAPSHNQQRPGCAGCSAWARIAQPKTCPTSRSVRPAACSTQTCINRARSEGRAPCRPRRATRARPAAARRARPAARWAPTRGPPGSRARAARRACRTPAARGAAHADQSTRLVQIYVFCCVGGGGGPCLTGCAPHGAGTVAAIWAWPNMATSALETRCAVAGLPCPDQHTRAYTWTGQVWLRCA